eukprot:EG_transcript_12604
MAFFFFAVPKHAATFVDTLKAVHSHCVPAVAAAKKEKRPLVVSSFGGGPLPDVLGLLLYLTDTDQLSPKDAVVIHVFDMEAWRPVMEAAATHAHKHFPLLSFHFHACDVTVADAEQVVVHSTDIFVFSYFMTEMRSYASQFADFFRGMMQVAKPGAVFISLDPFSQSRRNTQALISDLVNSCPQNAQMLFNSHLNGHSELNVPRYRYVDWSVIIQMERIAAKENSAFKERRLPRGKGKRRKEIFAFIRPAFLSRGSIAVWTRTPTGARAPAPHTPSASPPALRPVLPEAGPRRASRGRRTPGLAVRQKRMWTGRHGDPTAALSLAHAAPRVDRPPSGGSARKRKPSNRSVPQPKRSRK